jgi:PE-PPE domain
MRVTFRSIGIALGAGISAIALAVTPAVPTPAHFLTAATSVLYMRGTGVGGFLSDQDFSNYARRVVDSTPAEPAAPYDMDKVDYPAGFFPFSNGGITDPTYGSSVATGVRNLASAVADTDPDHSYPGDAVIIYGYSQSAVVASLYKKAHLESTPRPVTYLLVSNPARPNGGILERFRGLTIPILDITTTGATPTGGADTYDIAREYDGWADFPVYPLNILATANAIAGIVYLHGTYESQITPETDLTTTGSDIRQYRNTTYYTIGTDRLPILLPLRDIGVPDPILAMLDAPLRVIIEQGYNRGLNPGVPVPAQFFRIPDLIADAVNLISAIPVGIDDGIADAITPGNYNSFRPLGTTHAGMYGVGGRTPNTPDAATAPQSPAAQAPAPVSGAAAAPATRAKHAASAKPAAPVKSAKPAVPAKPRVTSAAAAGSVTKVAHTRKNVGHGAE